MVKVQVDIPEDLNKKLRIYVIERDQINKEEAIKNILQEVLKN